MNEVLICMLLNYVGINMVGLAVNSFLKAPNNPNPASAMLPRSTWFPILIKGTYLHVGILVVFVIAILLYWVLFKTTTGYEIRSIGFSPVASRYSGINVKRVMVFSMIVSGMIGGMVGSVVIMGSQHRLFPNFLVNYGYDAVAVSLLGGLNPFGVLVMALFFGALKSGGNAMQIAMGIPVSLVSVVVAAAILSIIAINQIRARFFNKRGR
jgi:simple sugar transport system permease protein